MHVNIPSLLIGILLGFFLLFGTITVWAQTTANGIQTIILQETISTIVSLDGKDVQIDLEIALSELDETVAITTRSQSETSDTGAGLANAGKNTIQNDDGQPDLIRNVIPPTDKGLMVTSPHIAFDEETEELTFGTEIGMLLNIHSINAKNKVAGEGIKQVIFMVTDLATEEIFHNREEFSSFYCLFGGDTNEECTAKNFAELGNRWPSTGKWIYNGDYCMSIYIETDDDDGAWNFPVSIQGGLDRPSEANSYGSYSPSSNVVQIQQAPTPSSCEDRHEKLPFPDRQQTINHGK